PHTLSFFRRPPPLPSPPFPYTTLFRSHERVLRHRDQRVGEPAGTLRGQLAVDDAQHPRRVGVDAVDTLVFAQRIGIDLDRLLLRDRKSTRLNSSHVKNSYAVFCLKKKK